MVPIQIWGIWSDGVVGIGSVPGVTDGVDPEGVVVMVGVPHGGGVDGD